MRNLLATTAIAAMMSLPAAAQQSSDSNQTEQAASNSGQQQQSGNDPQLQNRGVTINASDLMQQSVHIRGEAEGSATQEELPTEMADAPENWEEAGQIEDIIMTRDGQPNSVVLNVSDRQVEVSFDNLSLVRDSDDEGEFFVVYTGDRSQLEQAEEYDSAAREERGDQSYKEQSGNMDTAAGSAATGAAAGGTQSDDAAQTAESDSAMQSDEDTAQQSETDMSDDATQQAQADTGDTEMQSAEAEEEGVVLNEGGSTEQADTEQADAGMSDEQTDTAQTEEAGTFITEGEATDQAEVTDETEAEQSEMAATDQTVTPTTEGTTEGMNYLADTERDALTAEDMEGLSVYGSNGEDIGEISQLLIAEDGKIDNVVIDIGGFLGIGEKHVAVPFDELKLSRAEGGLMNDLRVDVSYSEEELESMQSWEE